MSLWPRRDAGIPATTAEVARAAFPHGCMAMRLRDLLGKIFADDKFSKLFAVRGRPAVPPGHLALVSVMQFAEGLTDRQAADAVRSRLDWKHLLVRHEAPLYPGGGERPPVPNTCCSKRC